jgi:hypothetical protein
MALATNIVLADAQGTPVNHTFIPLGPDKNGVFWFEDQSQTTPIGFWKISMESKRPGPASAGENSSKRVIRVKVGLHQPVLENTTNATVSGIAPAPVVSYIPRTYTEYLIPERASLLDRQNTRKMNANLQANAQVVAAVETLASLW